MRTLLTTFIEKYIRTRDYNKLFFAGHPTNPNFGDMLSLNIVDMVSKKKFTKAAKNAADLVAIGSVLEMFLKTSENSLVQSPLNIWGAGFIAEKGMHHSLPLGLQYEFVRPMNFHAVRGTLSLNILKSMGFDVSGITLGDPGILASKLLGRESVKKKYRLGILPHYVDREDVTVQELHKKCSGSVILDVYEDPMVLIGKMQECKTIASSAMHGLIVADSLNIPNIMLRISSKIHGGDFKFKDYYSIYDKEPFVANPLNLLEVDREIDVFIEENYQIHEKDVQEIGRRLEEVFPH